MQTQQFTQTTKPTRQEYNKLYYQKNRERLLNKKKTASSGTVFQLLTPTKARTSARQDLIVRSFRTLELVALIILILIMTYFLINESAAFYLETQDGPLTAYLKAAMVEGIAVLFSFSQSKIRPLRWAQRIVIVSLCGLTLWTMSGKLVKSAQVETSRSVAISQAIGDLERERSQKEELRTELLKKGWLGATRRYEKGIEETREKLISLRHKLAETKTPQVVANCLGILIAFRLLIVAANLICIHLLVEQSGFCSKNTDIPVLQQLNSG